MSRAAFMYCAHGRRQHCGRLLRRCDASGCHVLLLAGYYDGVTPAFGEPLTSGTVYFIYCFWGNCQENYPMPIDVCTLSLIHI